MWAARHLRYLASTTVRPMSERGVRMTLTDFLLARIAEDEAARDGARDSTGVPRTESDAWTWVRHSKAECERNRRIVEHCDFDHLTLSPGDPYVLQLLALPYADHPDFNPEWRI